MPSCTSLQLISSLWRSRHSLRPCRWSCFSGLWENLPGGGPPAPQLERAGQPGLSDRGDPSSPSPAAAGGGSLLLQDSLLGLSAWWCSSSSALRSPTFPLCWAFDPEAVWYIKTAGWCLSQRGAVGPHESREDAGAGLDLCTTPCTEALWSWPHCWCCWCSLNL